MARQRDAHAVPTDFSLEVARGKVTDHEIMWAMGERESMGTTASGEDIWRGTATFLPTPADAGEQMEAVSSSVQDAPGGTGARTIEIPYLDADGYEQTTPLTMNGTTGVALTPSDVRFVQDMYTLTVGSNTVAVGDIEIYKQGDATAIYNMIAAGGNKSMVPHRMVPRGKKLYLKGWDVAEAQGKRCAFRIRSTDMNETLLPGVFCFKGTHYINGTSSGELPLVRPPIPAFSIVKVSGWPDAVGAEGSCGWWGYLIDE